MYTQTTVAQNDRTITSNKHRNRLLEGLPISEQRLILAGIPTAVLAGGEGTPVILLHGPGETALWWMRVIPILAKNPSRDRARSARSG
jgi:pimeloyl-ACP methyl ester carboxylesterase